MTIALVCILVPIAIVAVFLAVTSEPVENVSHDNSKGDG